MTNALIIDDKPINNEVLGLLLEQEGVQYKALTTPTTVFDLLQSMTIHIIFLDLELPGYNAFDLAQEIKAKYPEIFTIAYTVHNARIENARRAGFDGFLGKPLKARRFSEQLRNILAGEPVWDA